MSNTQFSRLHEAFSNGSYANIKLSKTQLHRTEQSGGFSGRLLCSLLKNGLPLIANVLKPLAKSILLPSWLTAPASTTAAAVHNKIFGSEFTTLIISNEKWKISWKKLSLLKILDY